MKSIMYDRIVLEIVGYDENCWHVRYPHISDNCFWIPKESFFALDSPKEMKKKEGYYD